MGAFLTKVEAVQAIKNMIQVDDLYAYLTMKRIYQNQIQDEFHGCSQRKSTVELNKANAEICSAFLKIKEGKGFLSTTQQAVVREVLLKYANQFLTSCIKGGNMIIENGLVFAEADDYRDYKFGVTNGNLSI